MICDKCGATNPDNRNCCVNCGSPLDKPDWVEDIEKSQTYTNEENYFRGRNRYAIYGIIAGLIIVGIILSLILYGGFKQFPILILLSVLFFIIIPIISFLLLTFGIYKPGSILLFITAYTFVPIGIVGRVYLKRLWNFSNEVKSIIANGNKKFVEKGVVIKTPTPLKIAIIFVSVIIIVIPIVSYFVILNQPLLEISDYTLGDEYVLNGIVEVKLEIYNFGHETAIEDKITVTIVGSEGKNLPWEDGDIKTMESKWGSIDVFTYDPVKSIIIYYDGEKMDEQEIEGIWLRT